MFKPNLISIKHYLILFKPNLISIKRYLILFKPNSISIKPNLIWLNTNLILLKFLHLAGFKDLLDVIIIPRLKPLKL